MDSKILTIEQTYEAPLEKVWEALTNKDRMKQWYFDVSDFKPVVGFNFEFYGESKGVRYLHQCTVVEVVPDSKISYTWTYADYPGESLVTFELLREDINKTLVKLTHSGVDTFPHDNPDFAQESFQHGWSVILGESLRNFVETESFTQSVSIHADVKEIWNIVLNPDRQWGKAFGDDGAVAKTDWSEGSEIVWSDMKNMIVARGVVENHQPQKYLFLHYYDNPDPNSEASLGEYYEKFTLMSENNNNVLSIEIGKLAKSDIPVHQERWNDALDIIKELAEKV